MSIDPSSPGSWFTLTAMRGLKPREVRKEPPSPGLIAMFGELLHDQDPEVVAGAEEGRKHIQRTWPEIRMDAPVARVDRFTQPAIAIEYGRLLPFSGRIEKVSAKNINAKGRNVQSQAIYCLTERGLPDVYFFGASGLLILPQGSLSHQCLRLRNAEVPFAQVTPQDMAELPEGRFAIVRKDGISF
jgi:hypothetical protein